MLRFVSRTNAGSMAPIWRAMFNAVSSMSAGRDDAVDHADFAGAYGADAVLAHEDDLLRHLRADDPGKVAATIPAPNLNSGSPKNASSAAIVMSQATLARRRRRGMAHVPRRDRGF